MADKKKTTKSRSAAKSKVTEKAKGTTKKGAIKLNSARKTVDAKPKAKETSKKIKIAKASVKTAKATKSPRTKLVEKPVEVTRTINVTPQIRRPVARVVESRRTAEVSISNSNQFAFMKAPRPDYAFEVGDNVEVFCDHEKGRERVRGWIRGIVVQVDNKMVAVQFRSNVFLTDGWMVPDRILWYPLNSEHIRPVPGKKTAAKKELIPEY